MQVYSVGCGTHKLCVLFILLSGAPCLMVFIIFQVLGSATVRVRASKTAIHTNGLQREQDSNSGSKTPSPSRTGDTNSPGGSQSQARATSRLADRHTEVAQQSAQLRNHGQNYASTSGSPPMAPQTTAGPPPSQQGQTVQQGQMVQPGQVVQPQVQMGPSPAEVQQHLMAHMPPGMLQQQQLPHSTNGPSYGGPPLSMPMMQGHSLPHGVQQSGYSAMPQAMPTRSSGVGPRITNQNYAPTRSPTSGRASPSMKRGYDDVQQSNASAAAAAAAFLSKQQQQADDKRMRLSH